MAERRVSRRRISEIFYDLRDQATGAYLGDAEDVSHDGIRVRGPVLIEPGTRLIVTMPLGARMHGDDRVAFRAECRWCEDQPESGDYECGLAFVREPSPEQALLDHLSASMPFDNLRSF